uniref:MSP domain-containing protein n=1 Tax=Setaria digitata TaxID=48799 RepID=A0A915Q151_9BILA
MNEIPIVVEPSFPVFAPRPLKENLNKQMANLIMVNTSPHKLIFKITPNTTDVRYSIRPEIDYLSPHGSRLIGISISDAPQPKREHDFTYKVVALNPAECFGISATQYWEQNRLENDVGQLHEAQFVCLEPDAESKLLSSHRITTRLINDHEAKTSLTSDEYPKRIRRYTALVDEPIDYYTSPINSSAYPRKQSVRKDSNTELSYPCMNANESFWYNATAMRSFLYGFLFAFVCSTVLVIRKNR